MFAGDQRSTKGLWPQVNKRKQMFLLVGAGLFVAFAGSKGWLG